MCLDARGGAEMTMFLVQADCQSIGILDFNSREYARSRENTPLSMYGAGLMVDFVPTPPAR